MDCINCGEPVEKLMPMITFFTGSHVTITERLVHADSSDERCGYVGHWMDTVAAIKKE